MTKITIIVCMNYISNFDTLYIFLDDTLYLIYTIYVNNTISIYLLYTKPNPMYFKRVYISLAQLLLLSIPNPNSKKSVLYNISSI